MVDWILEIWFSELPGIHRVSKASWTMLFFIFCQIFGIFDDFSQICSTFGGHQPLWKIIKYGKNFGKKAWFNLPLKNPFFHAVSVTRTVTSSNSSNRRRDPHELRYELRSPTFGLCSITILVLYKSLKKVIGLWCVLPSIYATMVFSTPMSIQTQLLGT